MIASARRSTAALLVVVLVGGASALRGDAIGSETTAVTAVDTIGMTVSDMDRAVEFYTSVLTFEKTSDIEVAGREYELMEGVFGARVRIVRLRLGDESIELTEYLAPKGRPMPPDIRANDRLFQHVAVIVSDMDQAYARLRRFQVQQASTGPQTLPGWNRAAGGISAYYFRDPDGHFLEILHFPADKGLDKWHHTDRLFLGIDHTAIVVGDTDRTLKLYHGALGMAVVGESENYDTEQEHLNNVFGARLRITTLRAAAGPGIELLEYLAPGDGRLTPFDLKANDIGHWQTTLITSAPESVIGIVRERLFSLVSPHAITLTTGSVVHALLIRDLDGHGIRLASRRP